MKEIIFIGCSITKGEGLTNEKTDKNNYTNIVGKYFNATVKNLSLSGNSNYNIFMSGLDQILHNTPDVLVIQWSGLQRHWLYPNLDVKLMVCNNSDVDEINYLQTKFSKKFLIDFKEKFLLLNHDYQNILTLLNYCKILETIAKNQTQIVFINGLLPWTEEIQYKESALNPAKNFSAYTKNLLSINDLPDKDIILFFNKIYDALNQIDVTNWVNMFHSIFNLSIDYGNDNAHPGPASHKKIADIIINHMETR